MDMPIPKIEKLDDLLRQYVDKNKKIMDTKIKRLTQPGENYGSEILQVDVILESPDHSNEELNLVAKLIPAIEFFRIVFNVQVTFNSEKWFYDTIVPTLQKFQKKQGITDVVEFFPKYYGARKNLKNGESEVIDEDAIIILENLKVKGYINVPRRIGFDLPTTKLILKNLAQFHAVPVALKHNDPETFEANIKPFMLCFHPPGPTPPVDEPAKLIFQIIEDSKYKHLLPKLKRSFEKFGLIRKDFKEPFATLVHRDMWVNNVMVKFKETSPIDCKFVDFQMYSYDTPAADLFFFLFSSVEFNVLKENLDDLLKWYHKSFVDTLRSLKCDLNFSYDILLEEISHCIEWELSHTIFMFLLIINGKQDNKIKDNGANPPDFADVKFEDDNVQRILWMLAELEQRNWLIY